MMDNEAGKKELEWLYIISRAAALASTVGRANIFSVKLLNAGLTDGNATADTVGLHTIAPM